MLDILQIPLATGLLFMAADVVECTPPQSPRLFVRPKAAPTKYDYSYSTTELTHRGTDTISPYPRYAETHTGGITEGSIKVSTNMQFQHQNYPMLGIGCVFYDEIEVTLEMDPTIYIANNYKRNSCEFREISLHEQKHVNVDRDMVNKYARNIGESLRVAMNSSIARGPYPIAKLVDIQKQMQDYVSNVVKNQQVLLDEERFRRQQAVDSLDEYERIRKACE